MDYKMVKKIGCRIQELPHLNANRQQIILRQTDEGVQEKGQTTSTLDLSL